METLQEKQHTVVEAARVPHPVVAPGAPVEIHAVCAIKHVDAVVGVLAGVAVHNVNEHYQAQPVGLVHKSLQLIWSAEPAAGLHGKTRQMVFGACFEVFGAQCQ